MNERRANPRAGGDRARCLLWLPSGYEPPATLLDGLRARDVVVRQVADAPAVMAELAGGGFKTLLLVEPDLLRLPQRVVDAVGRYYPQTAVWRFDGEGRPVLRPWAGRPAHATETHPSPPPPIDHGEPRLAGDVPISEPLEPAVAEPPLLSDEELAMLLEPPEDESPS